MGLTPNYQLPYPECAPPLREDASDVGDLRALAEATDGAIQGLYDQAADQMFTPDTVRLTMSAGVATTGQNVIPTFTSTTFDNTVGNVMSSTVPGSIWIPEPGRYWIGGYSQITQATELSARMAFLIDGVLASNFQNQSGIYQPTFAFCHANVVLAFDSPGTLQLQIRHSASAALSWTYQARIWATQMLKY